MSQSEPGSSGLTQPLDEVVLTEVEKPVETAEEPVETPLGLVEPPVVRTFKTRKQYEEQYEKDMDKKAKKIKLKKARRTL